MVSIHAGRSFERRTSIKKKLAKPVSIDWCEDYRPDVLEDRFAFFEAFSEVPFTLEPGLAPRLGILAVREMPTHWAVSWFCRLNGLRYELRKGGIHILDARR